jgi:hypothetical protein
MLEIYNALIFFYFFIIFCSLCDYRQILSQLVQPVSHTVSQSDLEKISQAAHSYVGGDLRDAVRKGKN